MNDKKIVYLDNAATSYPKPNEVWEAVKEYVENIGASPGRSGHSMARKAEAIVSETREMLASLFCIKNPDKIAFTHNATHALNILIKGFLKPEDHVIITNFEHNSVIRPLERLKNLGISNYDIVSSDYEGIFDLQDFKNVFRPNTKLIVANHASNVIGVISPIEKISKIAHENGAKILVDVSQTAGVLDINVSRDDIDMLAFTGHKSLLGPPGTGGLYIQNPSDVDTLYEGGSGTNSHSPLHPINMPDKFEAGTLNYLGITGLNASIKKIQKIGIPVIREKEIQITEYCMNKLKDLPGVTVYGTKNIEKKVSVVSFNIKGFLSNEIATVLDNNYGVMTRPGLHCSPLIHQTLNTHPQGTIRLSVGWKNEINEIDFVVKALKEIILKQIHE